MNTLNPYLVTRPYCTPLQLIVIAYSELDAIKQTSETLGYCANATAELKIERGIILFGGQEN